MSIQPTERLYGNFSDLKGATALNNTTVSYGMHSNFRAIGQPIQGHCVPDHCMNSFLRSSRSGMIEANVKRAGNLCFRINLKRPKLSRPILVEIQDTPQDLAAQSMLHSTASLGTFYKRSRENRNFSDLIKEPGLGDTGTTLSCSEAFNGFLWLATNSKKESLSLQMHIATCNCIHDGPLQTKALQMIAQLVQHPLANYVLQKSVAKSPKVLKEAKKLCMKSFRDFAHNEYSSRVIQTIIQLDSDFCRFAVAEFRRDLKAYIMDFPSLSLVSVAIKYTRAEAEKNIFKQLPTSSFKFLFTTKPFKRVVISFINASELKSLDWICKRLLKVYLTPVSFLRDRYSVLILVGLFEKGHVKIQDNFIRSLVSGPQKFLQKELFHYFVSQLTTYCNCYSMVALIGQVLRQLNQLDMAFIAHSSAIHSRYCEVLRLTLHRY